MSCTRTTSLAVAAIILATGAYALEAPAADLTAGGNDADLTSSDSSLSYAYGHEYGHYTAPLHPYGAPYGGGHEVGYTRTYGHHHDDLGYGYPYGGLGRYGGVYGVGYHGSGYFLAL
jgi:hypothetical protein